jgi:1A family penicillin-binding protein
VGLSSVYVHDNRGRYVGRLLPQKRYWISLDHIPTFLQQALLAVEDARFYEHNGIDLQGIARALVKNVSKGEMVQGGSTITQQLIKNKFLTSERTLDRKLKEANLALEFEKKYTKRQILEMYFNEIYFGHGAWGIVQAARLYFDKAPPDLTETECLLLASVPKNPGRYNPFGKPEDVSGRRTVVLKRMLDLKLITEQRQQALLTQPNPARPLGQAPQYLAQVRNQLAARLGADTVEFGGLNVTASLDLDLQLRAEQALRDGTRRLSPDLQGALVCMDPTTGDVLAAVGDAHGAAFAARRQPGSAIKPFIYAAALEQCLTASDHWKDDPVPYDRGNGRIWKPLNYGQEQFGELSLRQALAHSNNIITVKVLDHIGLPAFLDLTARVGLPQNAQNGLSLALGTDDVTLGHLVQAYTPFAAGGQRAEARTILRIYDRTRKIWTENPPIITQVLSPEVAFITTQMMRDVLTYGTAKALRSFSQTHPAAGKTGTTDNYMDAWFVGFTPSLVTGIWLGHDQPRPEGKGFTGGTVAAPIWGSFMSKALVARPGGDFPQPEGITTVTIDPESGLPARAGCPKPQDEFYVAGTEPVEPCSLHGGEPLRALVPPAPTAPETIPEP